MIIFEKVKWKNFLSTGNTFIEIPLNKAKSTLIVGQNGSGKSTLLDAIAYGLFGKAHRDISKSQLINSINGKQAVVEIEFSIGSSKFKIIRGVKPNIFEIWKNDVMINQSSHAKEYQKILEQNILKLTHKSFHQVVVLGSSSFIPFMQLPAYIRRNVIEDLLDINIFSKMNSILKERTSRLREQLKDLSYKLDISTNKIETQKKYINDIQILTDENKQQYENKIESNLNKIKDLQKQNADISNGLSDEQTVCETHLKELHDQKNINMMANSEVQTQMRAIGKTAKFFETTNDCPTCKQPITKEVKASVLSEAKTEAKGLSDRMELIIDEAETISLSIDDWNKNIASVREQFDFISTNNKEISSLQNNIKQFNEFLSNDVTTDLTEAKGQLQKYIEDKSELYMEKNISSEQYNYNSAMSEMLKDTGIKTKIIKQYLPVMNKLINKYLQVLDFYVHFDLDEEFKETIRSRYRDEFTYDSFSEGEKQRIDLALLFTWRQIAKMKNSVSTNLLLLDETFDSSLDHEGVDNLLKILLTLPEDTNTFVISHKGEILDNRFDEKIEFKKVKNFSKIAL
jgi:DNA repair exonuclease SbcCD ATPase subunit